MLVIAGDGFELLAGPNPNIHRVLDAHAEFAAKVKAFPAGGTDRHVVVLSGNHDGPIAWDPDVVAALRDRLGATDIAVAVDLVLDTGDGPQRVHVVHGNQDDHYNAFIDVRSPIDTPMGHHVVRDVLPQLEKADKPGGLLEGVRVAQRQLAGDRDGGVADALPQGRQPAVVAGGAVPRRRLPAPRDVPARRRPTSCATTPSAGSSVSGSPWCSCWSWRPSPPPSPCCRCTTSCPQELATHTGIASHNAAARERAARMITAGYAGHDLRPHPRPRAVGGGHRLLRQLRAAAS